MELIIIFSFWGRFPAEAEGEAETDDQKAKSCPNDPDSWILHHLEPGVGSSSRIVEKFHTVGIILRAMEIGIFQKGPSFIG